MSAGAAVEHLRIDVHPSQVVANSAQSDESAVLPPLVPSRNLEKACLVILATLGIFYTLYFARSILLPITMAFVISLVLKPITKRLSRFGIPNVLSTILVMLAFSVMVVLGIRMVWEPANRWIEQTPRSIQKVRAQLASTPGPWAHLMKAKSEVEKLTSLPDGEGVQKAPVSVQVEQPPLTNRLLSSTGSFATSASITLTLLFFVLAAGDRFLEKAVQIRKTWREKRDIVLLVKEVEHKMSTYLGAITIINFGLGAAIGTGLWLIGMPNPLLWGVLAALLNYIPFAGLVIGCLIVSIVAIGEFSSMGHAMLAPAIYLLCNGIEANVVTPMVLGRSISLNPVVILLAVFLGGWIWGMGGIFLAVPLLLLAKIACDSNESLRPIGVFLAE
jgi:predicted PurR-regulated permease PerM